MSKPVITPGDYGEVLRVDEVAKKLNVTPRVVRRWIQEGKLKAKKIGRAYVVTMAAFKRFVAAPAGRK
jgi:excisionase family DNA binding protein